MKINNNDKALAEMISEPNYDMVVSTKMSKEQAEALEQRLFENGFVPYNGRDEYGKLLTGKLVKILKTDDELFLYISLDGGESSGKKGSTVW